LDQPRELAPLLLVHDLLQYGFSEAEMERFAEVKDWDGLLEFQMKKRDEGKGMILKDPSTADALLSQRKIILTAIKTFSAQLHESADKFDLFDKVTEGYHWAKILELEYQLIVDAELYSQAPLRPHHAEGMAGIKTLLGLATENTLRRFNMYMAEVCKRTNFLLHVKIIWLPKAHISHQHQTSQRRTSTFPKTLVAKNHGDSLGSKTCFRFVLLISFRDSLLFGVHVE
jgi:hypothetical protein